MNQLPPPEAGLAQREPVRVTYVIVGFVQAVVTVLLATEVFSDRIAAIVVGITTAAYIAISELFERNAVTPMASIAEPPQATTAPPTEPQSDT